MQEVINLRGIIEILIKGKKLIISITTIAFLISVILSYVVIKPTYETRAIILVNSLLQDENSELNEYLNEVVSPQVYRERLTSQYLIKRVIDKHKLIDWKVSELKKNLKVETEKDSNIITLTLEGENADLVYKTLNAIILEANVYIGETISARLSELANQYKDQLALEKGNLDEALEEYNTARAAEGLPTFVILDALTTKQKQYILNVDEKYLDELQSLDKNKQVEFQKLNNQVNTLTELYNKYRKNYEEARSVSKIYNVENKLTLVSGPEVPFEPISPNKVINMVMAIVLGLLTGIGIVLFRHYWNESEKGS
jgi:chain length determinant protein (polysaccharide antigen chain regulator)